MTDAELDQCRHDGALLRSIVADQVELKREGRELKGLCPFHSETTPSFTVYDDGHFHCFGCGAHGTSFDYVMKRDGVDFRAATERVAAEIGTAPSLPKRKPTTGKGGNGNGKHTSPIWQPILRCDMLHEYRDTDGSVLCYLIRVAVLAIGAVRRPLRRWSRMGIIRPIQRRLRLWLCLDAEAWLLARVHARSEARAKEREAEEQAKRLSPLTEAERAALREHAADLDGEDYELERDAIAEELSRGRKTKFRVTALDNLRKEIRQARADAEAARAAAAATAAVAALRKQPPAPPPDDTPEVTALIAEFNAKFFVLREHGKAIIYAPKHDPILNRRYYERVGFADLEKLYLNRTVLTGFNEKTGEPIYKPVARVWLHHSNRRQYIGGMVFDPSGRQQPDEVFNLWQGFGVTPKPGTWDRLANHLEVIICNNDPVLFYYFLDWMADMVQRPAKQGEVAIVMRGPEGTGKSIILRTLRHLLGQHGFIISSAKHLTGNFNAHQRDCIFLGADEALFAGDRSHVNVLKSIVTEPFLVIEPKGRDAVQSPNYLHLMMASNEDWVVPASLRSRRWLVLDANESRANDHPYFAAIQHELDHGGYEAMLHELLSRDISQSNLRDVPVTAALIDQRTRSLDTTTAWWLDVLMRGYVFRSRQDMPYFAQWLDPISTELLFASYTEFCTARRERHPLNRAHLCRWLGNVAKSTRPRGKVVTGEKYVGTDTTYTDTGSASRKVTELVKQDRAPSYNLGALAAARDAFTEATKLTVEWPQDDPAAP